MTHIDLEVLFDELVDNLRKDGKTFDWIREFLPEQVYRAVDELEDEELSESHTIDDDNELDD